MRSDPVLTDRKLLVSEVETTDGYKLVLDQAVFVEAGERYWTNASGLVVERVDGSEAVVFGSWETVCR